MDSTKTAEEYVVVAVGDKINFLNLTKNDASRIFGVGESVPGQLRGGLSENDRLFSVANLIPANSNGFQDNLIFATGGSHSSGPRGYKLKRDARLYSGNRRLKKKEDQNAVQLKLWKLSSNLKQTIQSTLIVKKSHYFPITKLIWDNSTNHLYSCDEDTIYVWKVNPSKLFRPKVPLKQSTTKKISSPSSDANISKLRVPPHRTLHNRFRRKNRKCHGPGKTIISDMCLAGKTQVVACYSTPYLRTPLLQTSVSVYDVTTGRETLHGNPGGPGFRSVRYDDGILFSLGGKGKVVELFDVRERGFVMRSFAEVECPSSLRESENGNGNTFCTIDVCGEEEKGQGQGDNNSKNRILIGGDCEGNVHGYDMKYLKTPLWSIPLCRRKSDPTDFHMTQCAVRFGGSRMICITSNGLLQIVDIGDDFDDEEEEEGESEEEDDSYQYVNFENGGEVKKVVDMNKEYGESSLSSFCVTQIFDGQRMRRAGREYLEEDREARVGLVKEKVLDLEEKGTRIVTTVGQIQGRRELFVFRSFIFFE